MKITDLASKMNIVLVTTNVEAEQFENTERGNNSILPKIGFDSILYLDLESESELT